MSSTIIVVKVSGSPYTVEIGENLLPEIAARIDELLNGKLTANNAKIFIVTSPEIEKLWAAPLLSGFAVAPTILHIEAGEQHKRLATIERLCEELAASGADRGSMLIALGGGVIGDLTGFLAAIYMRGIAYVQVPTTLLAQIDSSLGGKTGANLAAGKNLIGAFHHPLAVFADIDVLATLQPRELCSGLQEAVKAGIIRDRVLFDFLETNRKKIIELDAAATTHFIAAGVRVKSEIVSDDEHEDGLRMLLNFGHTFGHAIEAATNYTQLLHGEAVAWGMLAAIGIAHRRELISAADAARMEHLIRAYGPLQPFTADASTLVALTAKDKKNRGGTRSFILPTGIGSATIMHDVTEAELLAAAATLVADAKNIAMKEGTQEVAAQVAVHE